jgi:F0F1-type ATP synthase delta subunit
MLNKFITVLIIEISKFLTSNKEFFNSNKTEREKLLTDVKFPNSVKTYLTEVSELDFTTDLAGVIKLLKNSPVKLEKNKFLQAITSFLVNNFANDVYSLPLSYFKLAYKDQKEAAKEVIKSNSELANTLKEILTDYSYQEILNGIQSLAEKTFHSPLVVVQSPTEMELETKKEIRENLSQSLNQVCLPIFQVNKNLIGGLRLFVNGKVSDLSWIARINLITSLK